MAIRICTCRRTIDHVIMPDYLTHNPPTDSMPQMFLNNSLEKSLVGSHAFW